MILAVISNNERESNPDLCDAGEVLNQLNSQSQLRTGGLWVDCNSVGDGYYTSIYMKFMYLNSPVQMLILFVVDYKLIIYLTNKEA